MLTTTEQELRNEFETWFEEAAAKDLDAVMSHIASDTISFEHKAPLKYVGVDAIREVCKRGFDDMKGDFRWNIPDLQIIVRDDIAVTWWLNCMQAQEPGGPKVDMYSRGTRVFQRIDGKWKMIHQHVPFPYDPETGKARTDLKL